MRSELVFKSEFKKVIRLQTDGRIELHMYVYRLNKSKYKCLSDMNFIMFGCIDSQNSSLSMCQEFLMNQLTNRSQFNRRFCSCFFVVTNEIWINVSIFSLCPAFVFKFSRITLYSIKPNPQIKRTVKTVSFLIQEKYTKILQLKVI